MLLLILLILLLLLLLLILLLLLLLNNTSCTSCGELRTGTRRVRPIPHSDVSRLPPLPSVNN